MVIYLNVARNTLLLMMRQRNHDAAPVFVSEEMCRSGELRR